MTNAGLGGIEASSYYTLDAYRSIFYALGWRSVDDPLFTGTGTGAPNPIPASIEDLAYIPAIARWRQKLAQARAGGLSVQLVIIGDSMSEGFTASKYRLRWIDHLRRRIQGFRPGSMGYLPASANIGAQISDANWPGGDSPWTYTGATGSPDYGPGLHAVSITSGTATLTYFGDVVNLFYVRTPTGPSAAAVTLDGVAQTAINANGSALPGQIATFGTVGAYGFHTLVVTVSTGTLIIEGAWWFDGEFNGLTSNNSVMTIEACHAGGSAKDWSGANNDWSAMFAGTEAYSGLVLVATSRNDSSLGRSAQQYEDDLVTIATRMDARLGVSDTGYLFTFLPGDQPVTGFLDAAWRASARIGLTRAGVFDLGQMRPSRTWGADLEDDGVHPNDAGHVWLANELGNVLDPVPLTPVPVTPQRQVIDATTPATFRSAWTAAITPVAGTAFAYDEATASALRERRHRVWLDPGTYQAVITAEHATGRGILEVLIGKYAGNTPTLTSCGTVDTSTPAGPALTTTVLGTQVTTDVGAWVSVVIRKTNTATVGRFVHLVINKTA